MERLPPRADGTRLGRALAASALVHAALVAIAVWLAPGPVDTGTDPGVDRHVEVSLVPRPVIEADPGRSPDGRAAPADARSSSGSRPPAAASRSAEDHGTTVPAHGPPSSRDPRAAREELGRFRDLRRQVDGGVSFAPRADAGDDPFAAAPRRGKVDPLFAAPTDAIDGVPDLGSGAPGDPRIPGSGGVDIAAVARRDGVVGTARLRASQGQVHPYLKDAKDQLENCWLPVAADAAALAGNPDARAASRQVPDPGCAAGAHVRFRIARVEAVYDASGTRLAFRLVGASTVKDLAVRVRDAFDRTPMPDVPPELLGDDGRLHVAWNVFLDDYSMCNLLGEGANAHKPGGDTYIGIVELDGLY